MRRSMIGVRESQVMILLVGLVSPTGEQLLPDSFADVFLLLNLTQQTVKPIFCAGFKWGGVGAGFVIQSTCSDDRFSIQCHHSGNDGNEDCFCSG